MNINNKLSKKQRGTFAEYRVISELIKLGFDVYTPCVDEIGIDCIIKSDSSKYYDIQIKKSLKGVSIRGALPIYEYLKTNPDNYYLIVIIANEKKQDEMFYLTPEQISNFIYTKKYEDKNTGKDKTEKCINVPAEKRDELIKSQSLEILRDIL